MSVTRDDLNDFQTFAVERLAGGEVESIGELVLAWEEKRRQDESIAALKESHADAEAGRVVSSEHVFAESRKALGLPE